MEWEEELECVDIILIFLYEYRIRIFIIDRYNQQQTLPDGTVIQHDKGGVVGGRPKGKCFPNMKNLDTDLYSHKRRPQCLLHPLNQPNRTCTARSPWSLQHCQPAKQIDRGRMRNGITYRPSAPAAPLWKWIRRGYHHQSTISFTRSSTLLIPLWLTTSFTRSSTAS